MQENQSKKIVVARLTAVRDVGVKTIIEVCEDATFSSFYVFYVQQGNRRNTKKLVRSANRNEGLYPWHRAYRMQPGLDVIAKRFEAMPQIKKVTVRILRKRAYRKLLEVAPDVLGMTQVRSQPDPKIMRAGGYPIALPVGYLTIKKRMDIILGRG